LGNTYTIDRFTLNYSAISWEKACRWQILVSEDNDTWTPIGMIDAQSNVDKVVETIYTKPINARYVKMVSSVGKGQYLRAHEIDVFGYISKILGKNGYVVPANDTTGVTNTGVGAIEWAEVHFGYDMDISSLTPENIVVKDADGNTVSFDSTEYEASAKLYKFKIAALKSNTKYTVTINGVKRESQSEPVDETYIFSFTTGAVFKGVLTADDMIKDTYPANGATGVTNETEQYLEIEFKVTMDTNLLVPENIIITDSENNVIPYDSYDSQSLSYKVDLGYLSSDTHYTVTLKDEVITELGKKLDTDYSFSFTTGQIYKSYTVESLISEKYPMPDEMNVTNVAKSGMMKIKLNKEVDKDLLSKAVIIKDENENEISSEHFIVSETEIKLDISKLDSNMGYTVTVKKDKLQLGGGNRVIGDDYSYYFKTGLIIDLPAVEGKVILNIAKNKKIIGENIAVRPLTNVNDGDRSTAGEISGAAGLYTMDLGGYYDIKKVIFAPASSFDYSKDNLNYHITGLNIMTSSSGISEEDFSVLATTSKVGNGEPYVVDVSDDINPVRYIGLKTSNVQAIVGEFEVYIYADEVYSVSYTKDGDNYVFDANQMNYTSEMKKAYFVVLCNDENGKLLSVKSKVISVASGTVSPTESIVLNGVADGTKSITACIVRGFSNLIQLAEPIDIIVE